MVQFLSPFLLVGTVTGVCSAPEIPEEPALSKRDPMADAFLMERLDMWQERLRLTDWTITVLQASRQELREGTLGNIHWNLATKEAKIRVLAASDYQMPYRAALRDMETTLVHELIHLELASLPRTDASRGDEEHAVNRMTDALLALDRGEVVERASARDQTSDRLQASNRGE